MCGIVTFLSIFFVQFEAGERSESASNLYKVEMMNIYDRLPSVDFSASKGAAQQLETLRSTGKPFFASRVQVGKLAGLTAFDAGVHLFAGVATFTTAVIRVPFYRVVNGVTPRAALVDTASHLLKVVKLVVALASTLIGLVRPEATIACYRKLGLISCSAPAKKQFADRILSALNAAVKSPKPWVVALAAAGVSSAVKYSGILRTAEKVVVPVAGYSPLTLIAGVGVVGLTLSGVAYAVGKKLCDVKAKPENKGDEQHELKVEGDDGQGSEVEDNEGQGSEVEGDDGYSPHAIRENQPVSALAVNQRVSFIWSQKKDTEVFLEGVVTKKTDGSVTLFIDEGYNLRREKVKTIVIALSQIKKLSVTIYSE